MKTTRNLMLVLVAALVGVSCNDGGEEPTTPAPTTAAAATTAPPTAAPTTAAPTTEPTADATEGTEGAVDTKAQADAIVSCLADADMEAKAEKEDLPIYGEEFTIGVTFVFESVGATVPDAVTVTLYPSADAAKKAKKEIDENLLEGDTPTVLVGNAVLDDFGSTLTEPEAADQAQALQTCVEESAA